MNVADLLSLERDLQSDRQNLELAHRWLNALERAPLEVRNRPFVADLLNAIAKARPSDKRILLALEERWLALGRDYDGFDRVEDLYRYFSCCPPQQLTDLGVLAVPALCRLLKTGSPHDIDNGLQALEGMGVLGTAAFEDCLALSIDVPPMAGSSLAEALLRIEPDPRGAAGRVLLWLRSNPHWPIERLLRLMWIYRRMDRTGLWWPSLISVLKLSNEQRAALDLNIAADLNSFKERRDDRFLEAITRVIGDQPHFLRKLSRVWRWISKPRRHEVLSALRKWRFSHPRVLEFILRALDRSWLLPSQVNDWPWTRVRGALRLIPALQRTSSTPNERRHCAQALANLSRHQEHRLTCDRDANKIKDLLETGLTLAIDLAQDIDPCTARFGLRALSRFASFANCAANPKPSAILRKALLSENPERVRAAATTGLWPLSQADLRALQERSGRARRALRRRLCRILPLS